MGYCAEAPPRHGHRTPAELAEDLKLAAAQGYVFIPGPVEETGPVPTESVGNNHWAVVTWADAHPLESALSHPRADAIITPASGEASSRTKKPKEQQIAITQTLETPPLKRVWLSRSEER